MLSNHQNGSENGFAKSKPRPQSAISAYPKLCHGIAAFLNGIKRTDQIPTFIIQKRLEGSFSQLIVGCNGYHEHHLSRIYIASLPFFPHCT
jgi:hypothetical protein